MEEILKKYALLEHLNVSRETCVDFESFISMIVEKNNEINIISKKTSKNKEINLIGSSTEENSRERHIIDSAQIIDFIDENDKKCIDIGTGSGPVSYTHLTLPTKRIV